MQFMGEIQEGAPEPVSAVGLLTNGASIEVSSSASANSKLALHIQ